jgi:hypothetical protein
MNISVDPETFIEVTENHGGYLRARCKLCRHGGWLDGKLGYGSFQKGVMSNRLIHNVTCPINKYLRKHPGVRP